MAHFFVAACRLAGLLAIALNEEKCMDNWSFGFTMTVVGLGGTFLTLGLLILFVEGLKKVFPFNAERDS